MSEKINVDGRILDPAEAVVPAMDHGFLFGDSVYETLRAYGGTFFRFDAHLERLRHSAAALELTLPLRDDEFRRRCAETIAAAGEREAAARIVVTRGVGPMSLDPRECGPATVLVYARPAPSLPASVYQEGVALRVVERERNPRGALDPNVKSGNYLNNLLAYVEARKSGAFEAVMLNAAGNVTECSTSNIFIVRDGGVRTPPLSSGLLSGITRRTVLDLCEAGGIPVEESDFGPDELRSADEAFITSSIKQVLPVTRIGGAVLGDGVAGPTTRRLLAAYREEVSRETGVALDPP